MDNDYVATIDKMFLNGKQVYKNELITFDENHEIQINKSKLKKKNKIIIHYMVERI